MELLTDILDAPALFQLHKQRFTRKVRLNLYRALIQLQKTQVPLFKSLRILHDSYSNEGRNPHNITAMVLADAIKGISGGSQRLTKAIQHWLPADEAAQLIAGEEAGHLIETLQSMTKLIKVKSRIMETMLKKMTEPALLAVLALRIAFEFAEKIIPAAARSHDPSTFRGAAYIDYALSMFVTHNETLLYALPLGLIVFIMWSLPRSGQGSTRLFLENFPPWSIYKSIHGATFLLNIATLLDAGIPLFEGMGLLRDHATPWLRYRIELTMFGLRQGKNLGQALANTEMNFPDSKALPFLMVLSSQNGFEKTISVYADEWLDETLTRVEASLEALKVALQFGFAVLAGVMFFGMAGMGGLPSY